MWLLAEGGADIAYTNDEGNDALLCAALESQPFSTNPVPTIEWLLEHGGADIEVRNTRGRCVWDLPLVTSD